VVGAQSIDRNQDDGSRLGSQAQPAAYTE